MLYSKPTEEFIFESQMEMPDREEEKEEEKREKGEEEKMRREKHFLHSHIERCTD
jgi:hypothetical protein